MPTATPAKQPVVLKATATVSGRAVTLTLTQEDVPELAPGAAASAAGLGACADAASTRSQLLAKPGDDESRARHSASRDTTAARELPFSAVLAELEQTRNRALAESARTTAPKSTPSGRRFLPLALLFGALGMPTTAFAQTDYYNTDRGRPVLVEDAYVTERYAMELKLAPVRLARTNGGTYNLGLEPEIAFGILPRTQIEVGLPLAFLEQGSRQRSGLAGLELSVTHNFNVETERLPALGLRGDVLSPVGALGPDHAYASLTALATRTLPWARFHVNGQYTFGASPSAAVSTDPIGGPEVSRWLVGGAIDKTYPLHSALVTAELYGRKPLESGDEVELTAGTGTRFQITPTLTLDSGFGRHLNGHEKGWYVTFGGAYAFSVRSLFPGTR